MTKSSCCEQFDKGAVFILNGSDEGCITFRITGFGDFVYLLVFQKLENATFRKLDLFPSSVEGGDTYSVGSLR
jgi:hypothetical protein